ncbi:unnamed protein product [Paramecium octaurelia]|uniref:Uncharacterized protein n=1 Tax=Paramecium octaurelia TaxID=43137 RepID=A0A8S1XZ86_PAROT|nr:unnamed protein product [Paramecium octaurelia]
MQQFFEISEKNTSTKNQKNFQILIIKSTIKCSSSPVIRIKTDHPRMDFTSQIWKMESQKSNSLWSLENTDRLAMSNCTDINSLGSQSIMPSSIFHPKKRQGKQKRQ